MGQGVRLDGRDHAGGDRQVERVVTQPREAKGTAVPQGIITRPTGQFCQFSGPCVQRRFEGGVRRRRLCQAEVQGRRQGLHQLHSGKEQDRAEEDQEDHPEARAAEHRAGVLSSAPRGRAA